jgi:hypothetical protein
MFIRTAVIALFASAVTLVKGQNVGDGTFLLSFLGICLILSQGTYYTPGLGACGISNTASDPIVAMAYQTFDNYPYVTFFGWSLLTR